MVLSYAKVLILDDKTLCLRLQLPRDSIYDEVILEDVELEYRCKTPEVQDFYEKEDMILNPREVKRSPGHAKDTSSGDIPGAINFEQIDIDCILDMNFNERESSPEVHYFNR